VTVDRDQTRRDPTPSLTECRSPGVEHEWRKTYDGRRFSIWRCRRCGMQITDADIHHRRRHSERDALMVDRDQIRRDAERGCSVGVLKAGLAMRLNNTLGRHVLALLSELEQAEAKKVQAERELHEIDARLEEAEELRGAAEARLEKAEELARHQADEIDEDQARLAKVPALVEAAGKHLEECCRTDFPLGDAMKSHAALCDALAVWEQE
jgi:hypothetical protein